MSEPDRLRNLSPAGISPSFDIPRRTSAPWLDGASTAVVQLRGQLSRVAPYFRTALLVGESGCGEEAAAHILQQLSPLYQRPFVNLSSADAVKRFAGPHAEDALASAGMVYIPRPERLSPVFQAMLLRLLRKYGANVPRIVAFAGRSLRTLVCANGFSAELADHLGALRIVVPPLRDRREDIPQLLDQILKNIAAESGNPQPELAPDLIEAARSLPWRGNLPQLYSAAEGLMERAPHRILHAQDLDAVLGAISPPIQSHREVRMMRLDDVIQEHVRAVLSACNGNKLRSAEILGISRSTLYRMLETPLHPNTPFLAVPSLQLTH